MRTTIPNLMIPAASSTPPVSPESLSLPDTCTPAQHEAFRNAQEVGYLVTDPNAICSHSPEENIFFDWCYVDGRPASRIMYGDKNAVVAVAKKARHLWTRDQRKAARVVIRAIPSVGTFQVGERTIWAAVSKADGVALMESLLRLLDPDHHALAIPLRSIETEHGMLVRSA